MAERFQQLSNNREAPPLGVHPMLTSLRLRRPRHERASQVQARHRPRLRSHDPRPKSAVSTMTGVVGLAGLFAWTAVARAVTGMDGPLAALTALLRLRRADGACGRSSSTRCTAIPRPGSTGSGRRGRSRRSPTSASPRSPACGGSGRSIGAPLLHRPLLLGAGAISSRCTCLASRIVPMLVLSVPYVLWLDRRLIEPRDGAWHFGQLLIGRLDLADRTELAHFFRAWAVKGFFTRLHDLDRARQLVGRDQRRNPMRSSPTRSSSPSG